MGRCQRLKSTRKRLVKAFQGLGRTSRLRGKRLNDREDILYPMGELGGFLRIHRSVIVNSAAVQEIHPCDTGEYMLRTRGGKEYTVSRTYKSNLKNIAQFWVGTDALILE